MPNSKPGQSSSSSMDQKNDDEERDFLLRLIEKQEEELEILDERIKLYTGYKEEYQKLKTLLLNMQEKVKYKHDIPIAGSKLAFIPGQIIHTNEINVLLGDNLFALRSTKQSCQIIERRLASVTEMLKQTEEAKKKTHDWLNATIEHRQHKQDFVEIIETR